MSENTNVNNKSGKKFGMNTETIVSLAILLVFVIVFIILLCGMENTNPWDSIELIINKAVPYILAGVGTLFVTAMGGTDITQGAMVGFEFAVVVVVGTTIGGFLGIICGLLCGVVYGFILGFINVKFKVPSFMVSLGLLMFFRALATMVAGTAYIDVPDCLKVFGNYYVMIPIVVVLYIVFRFIFHNTSYGYYVRAIGENENAVKFSGVNVNKVKIIAFIIGGFLVSVGILLSLGTKSTMLPSTAGLGFEMSVLIAMFIGGIPVQGGLGCKMYKVIIGAFTVAVMENVLGSLLLLETYYVQLIKGIILIAILFTSVMIKQKAAKNAIKAK